MMNNNYKYIRDPLYGFIELDKRIFNGLLIKIIDTYEFQRLRYIRQLGLSYFTYPSATHTRFDHSLGVYSLARELLDKIPSNEVSKFDKNIFLVVSLLHDIGHAALSHVYEETIKYIGKKRLKNKKFLSLHEEWTLRIIEDPSTKICKLLDSEDILLDVKSLLYFIYRDVVIERKTLNRMLRDTWVPLIRLLSSEIDIDRLDYTLRDSYFTGVASGIYDIERLKRSLLYDSEFKRLTIRERDIQTLEGFFISRYHMYRMVYYHKTTLSAETVFKKMMLRAWDLIYNKKPPEKTLDIIEFLLSNDFDVSLNIYLELLDPIFISQIYKWRKTDDNILRDLSNRIITRRLFKPMPIKKRINSGDVDKIKQILTKEGFDPEYYYEYVPNKLPKYHPSDHSKYEDSSSGLLLLDSRRDISKVSPFIKSLINITPEVVGFIMLPTKEIRKIIEKIYYKNLLI